MSKHKQKKPTLKEKRNNALWMIGLSVVFGGFLYIHIHTSLRNQGHIHVPLALVILFFASLLKTIWDVDQWLR